MVQMGFGQIEQHNLHGKKSDLIKLHGNCQIVNLLAFGFGCVIQLLLCAGLMASAQMKVEL